MTRRLLLSTAGMALLLLVVPVAASPVPEPGKGQQPRPAATARAFTVTDAAGRRVTFNQVPERIVIGGRAVFMVADALYAFPGAWSRLLGAAEVDQGLGNFLVAVDPKYGEKVTIPGAAGAEEVAALKPDSVILKSFMAESLGKPLEALGIPVLYVDFESPEEYRRDLLVFGELLQNVDRANEIWRLLETQMAAVTSRTAALSEESRPRVLFLYDAPKGGEHVFNVPPAGWIQTRLVEMAGGKPIWKETNTGRGWNRVGFEQIAAWNPDWVFMVSYRQDVDGIAAGLRRDAAWGSLKAVRDGHLVAFPVDYYSWDQPDLRWILGLKWLAARMHPQLFKDVDLEREVIAFFSFLYGMSEESVRRSVIANLRGGYR